MTVRLDPNALPTRKFQLIEMGEIIARLGEALLKFQTAYGPQASDLRTAVGDLQSYYVDYFYAETLPEALLACFTAAINAGITLGAFDHVVSVLMAEEPGDGMPLSLVQTAIMFAMAQEVRVILTYTFTSRDDVEVIQARMKKLFDAVRDMAADAMDSAVYAALLQLSASLSRYLAETARPLPRLVTYQVTPLPALALANRIYGDASRWDEIVKENRIIHPMFCPASVRVLSA